MTDNIGEAFTNLISMPAKKTHIASSTFRGALTTRCSILTCGSPILNQNKKKVKTAKPGCSCFSRKEPDGTLT